MKDFKKPKPYLSGFNFEKEDRVTINKIIRAYLVLATKTHHVNEQDTVTLFKYQNSELVFNNHTGAYTMTEPLHDLIYSTVYQYYPQYKLFPENVLTGMINTALIHEIRSI